MSAPPCAARHGLGSTLFGNTGAVFLLLGLACSRAPADATPGAGAPGSPAGASAAAGTAAAAGASPLAPVQNPPDAPASTARASSAPPPSPEVAAAPLSESAVRDLVNAWLDAQNRGDFAAYEKLYADRFTGIKRSGERTRSFGRKDWMADRASMFERPMRVTASKLDLTVSPSLARVSFEQTWSSAKYRDVGPKELLIVAGSSSAQIAREEMLSSTIGSDRPVAPQTRLRLVDTGFVILSSEVKPDWSRGTLRSSASALPGVSQVLRDADEARLPAALAQQKDRALRVFDAQGKACDSRIASLAVRAVMVPHFGMGQPAEDGTRPSDEQLNQEIWTLSEEQGRELVGVLEPACDGLFALDSTDVSPDVYPPIPVEGELRQSAVAAFRGLPIYAAIQRRYAEETQTKTPWHEDPTRHVLDVWSFTPRTGQRLLVVAAEAGEYCGGFGGGANAVFGVDARGKLSALGAFEGEAFAPQAAFDLDADGQLEILSGPEHLNRERALLHRRGAKVVREVLSSVPFLDCPC